MAIDRWAGGLYSTNYAQLHERTEVANWAALDNPA